MQRLRTRQRQPEWTQSAMRLNENKTLPDQRRAWFSQKKILSAWHLPRMQSVLARDPYHCIRIRVSRTDESKMDWLPRGLSLRLLVIKDVVQLMETRRKVYARVQQRSASSVIVTTL